MEYKMILWDWNGTLLNDVQASFCAVNDLLDFYGRKAITLETYKSYMQTPVSGFYAHIFDFSEIPYSEIIAKYIEGYHLHENLINITNEAPEILAKINLMKKRQVILSSGWQKDIERLAEKFEVKRFFSDILGSEDINAESKISRAQNFIGKSSVNPSECLVVGDTLHDKEVADAIGADCVLFSGGHESAQNLMRARVPVLTSFSEVERVI